MLATVKKYRWTEFSLLIIPAAIIILETFQLQLISSGPKQISSNTIMPPIDSLIPAFGLISMLLILNIILNFLAPDADQLLLPVAGLLSSIGVLMATRLGPNVRIDTLGTRQFIWFVLGLGFCIMTLYIFRTLRSLKLYKYTWAAIGIVLVAITLIHAHNVNFNSPTHDQLSLGPSGLNFQPSELLKLCLVIFFASYLDENREILSSGGPKLGFLKLPPMRQLGPLIGMLLISLLIFVGLREIGLAILIFGIFLSMIYLGSGRWTYVLGSLVLFVVGAYICYHLFGYVRTRVEIALNPFPDAIAENQGYQIIQGLIALGSGGILGAGLGLGHPAFVPAVQTDYIFAALGEEFGLAGLMGLVALYTLLIARGFKIAIEAKDAFNQLLAAGLTSVLAIQTIVIIAGNLKLIPLTGIPLPFISYGGSSLIANFIIIGILLRISANSAKAPIA